MTVRLSNAERGGLANVLRARPQYPDCQRRSSHHHQPHYYSVRLTSSSTALGADLLHSSSPRSKSNGGKIGKIVGIVIGCIIAVAVLAYIAYVLKKKRDAKRLTSASRGVVGDAEKGEGLERTVTKS